MPLIASQGGVTKGPSAPQAPKPPKPVTPVLQSGKAQGFGVLPGMPGSAQATLGSSSSPGGGGGVAPQLDATALANIAAYLNKTGTSVANDQASITSDQTALQNALAQDRQANQLANLRLMTTDNASGGFYGSAYGQQLGNQNSAYGLKETTATNNANLAIGKLQNAIAQMNASEPIYADQQAAAAAQRASASAAKLAPASTTATIGTAAPAAPAGGVTGSNALSLAQRIARGTSLGPTGTKTSLSRGQKIARGTAF